MTRLLDGTDISRMTVDQIDEARRKADQRFFEQSRKLSPKFPDVATELERRRLHREKIAARVLLWGFVPVGLIDAAVHSPFGWAIAATGLLGFITICVISGSRLTNQNGGRGGRPF